MNKNDLTNENLNVWVCEKGKFEEIIIFMRIPVFFSPLRSTILKRLCLIAFYSNFNIVPLRVWVSLVISRYLHWHGPIYVHRNWELEAIRFQQSLNGSWEFLNSFHNFLTAKQFQLNSTNTNCQLSFTQITFVQCSSHFCDGPT